METDDDAGRRGLGLGTVSFAVCFAAWGLISALAPRSARSSVLSASQTALLVAVPVSDGSCEFMSRATGTLGWSAAGLSWVGSSASLSLTAPP